MAKRRTKVAPAEPRGAKLSAPSSTIASPLPHAAAGASELIVALGAIVGLLVFLFAVTQSWDLFTRHFWLDEIHTWLLASDPDTGHMVRALLGAVDTNVPLLHLLFRGLHALGLPLELGNAEPAMRLVTAAATAAGLLGIYATLRLAFSRMVSAAAMVTILANPLLLQYAVEVRFYSLWLALCAWLCYLLGTIRGQKHFSMRHLALVLVTAALLLVHYFGAITLALAVAADICFDRRSWKLRLLARWPVWLGCTALAIVAWFYVAQRQAYHGSWMELSDISAAGGFFYRTLSVRELAEAAGILLLAFLVTRFLHRRLLAQATALNLAPVAGLLGLLGLPIVLVVISLTLQPAALDRYGLPGLCGVALPAALMYRYLRPPVILAAMVLFVINAALALMDTADEQVGARALVDKNAQDIGKLLAAQPPGTIMLFDKRHELYEMSLYHPELRDKLAMLDFEVADQPLDSLQPSATFQIAERDSNRIVAAFYPIFGLVRQRDLARRQLYLFYADYTDETHLKRRLPIMQYQLLARMPIHVEISEMILGHDTLPPTQP